MSVHDDLTRANAAKRLLENPLYKESWSLYEAALLEVLANANTTADKALEVRGWLLGARKARGHLERIVKEGQLAAHEIEQEETRKRTFAQRMFR